MEEAATGPERWEARLEASRPQRQAHPLASTKETFNFDWLKNKKRIRRTVGTTPDDAKSALALQLRVVTLRDQGIEADVS